MIQSLNPHHSLKVCKVCGTLIHRISRLYGVPQASSPYKQFEGICGTLESVAEQEIATNTSVPHTTHIYNIYMSMRSLAQYILYIIFRAGRSATEKFLSSSKLLSIKKVLASSLKILVCRDHPKGFSTNEELNRGKGADLFISTRRKFFFSGKLLSFRKLFGLVGTLQFFICRVLPKGFSTNEKLSVRKSAGVFLSTRKKTFFSRKQYGLKKFFSSRKLLSRKNLFGLVGILNQGWGADKKMSLQPILPTLPVITKLHGDSMTKLETILSIDLGTNTGWAFRSKNGQITSGTIYFKPQRFEGGGMRYLRFCLWLDELLETTGKIDAVYFEEVRRHLGVTAAHTYGGFLGHLTSWCEHYKIPYLGVPVGTIKRFIAGKGNAGKEDVIAAIRSLGHKPADDNESDALALLYLAMNKHKSYKMEK
jgi:Holliday junction resolvasome RuvABC endonuclease subunit